MKIASNCTLVAAALSTAYRTYNGHDFSPSSTTLEDFLDHNGILLTMCMRYRGIVPWLECSRPKPKAAASSSSLSFPGTTAATRDVKKGDKDPSRLEASWVQQDQTRGFHVIGYPIDIGPPVGLILRPSGTSIRCIYPVDGLTDGRDDEGCGPVSDDPRYGSQGYDHAKWYKKVLIRGEIVGMKNSLFGPNKTWESIPCTEFFEYGGLGPPSPGANTTTELQLLTSDVTRRNSSSTDNNTHYDWKYQTQPQYMIDYYSHILGHTLCNQSDMPPNPSPDTLGNATMDLIYVGPSSWPTHEWPAVVELMQSAIDDPPFSLQERLKIWNELVLTVPVDIEEFGSRAVQAVFYIKGISGVVVEEIARMIGQREAKRLRKPLLYIDLSAGGVQNATEGDIFKCAETWEEQQSDDDDLFGNTPRF